MQTVYLVRANADSTEGRGPMIAKFAFTTEVDAREIEQGMHPYRKDDMLVDVVPFPLYSSTHDYTQNNDKAAKEKALAKLSDYEKKLLGLRT